MKVEVQKGGGFQTFFRLSFSRFSRFFGFALFALFGWDLNYSSVSLPGLLVYQVYQVIFYYKQN